MNENGGVWTLNNYDDPLIINGTFIVNNNFSFQNCDNIQFGPKAQIIIEPNYQLKIINSNLYACGDEMWSGILIDGNIVANSNGALGTGLLIQNGSEISDAEIAVDSRNDSQINITNSDFAKNWQNIKVSDYQAKLNGAIHDNSFDCTTCGTDMLPPHEDLRSYSAIELLSVPGTAFDISDNTVNEAEIGFYGVNSGMDIKELNNIQNVQVGIGVVAPAKPVKITNNDITDCDYGVLLIYNVAETVNIYDNRITTNDINTGLDKYPVGIMAYGYLGYPSFFNGITNIGSLNNGNKINSNGEAGILLLGANNVSVSHNEIVMPDESAGGEKRYGILGHFATHVTINDNKINDPDYGGFVCDECEFDDKTSIYLSQSENATVHCNRLNATYTGLKFVDNCGASSIRGNTLMVHYDGYCLGDGDLGIGGEIGNQVATENPFNMETELPGNYWKGSDDGSSTTSHSITNETHTFNTADVPVFQTNLTSYGNGYYTPTQNEQTSGIAILPSEQEGSNAWECVPGAGFEREYSLNRIESIIDDSYEISIRESQFSNNLKMSVFNFIKFNMLLTEENELLESFYDTAQSSNYSSFWKIDSIISTFGDTLASLNNKESGRLAAISLNSSISPRNIMEENLKEVNNIYLITIAARLFSFSTEQIEDIEDIANQCPFEGGIAVYKARAMKRIQTLDSYWDDQVLCSIVPKMESKSNDIDFINVYPNPADEYVTIDYKSSQNGRDLKLYDIQGKPVNLITLDLSQTKISFKTSQLPSGIYTLEIACLDDATVSNQKIVIIH